MIEEDYYDDLEEFLTKEFNCFVTGQRVGTGHVGQADIAGVRDIGGLHSPDVEVIAIEVKTKIKSFCKNLGQAIGYSIFADKCYLAIPFNEGETFSLEQKEMASHLGVGLINCNDEITEVTSSNKFYPMFSMKLKLLGRLGYYKCLICGNIVEVLNGGSTDIQKAMKKNSDYKIKYYLKDENKGRTLLFTERSIKVRPKIFWVCRTCIKTLKLYDADQ